MRVFLFNEKLLSSINRKEEITDDTFLITDQEADKINDTLAHNGEFWVVDKYTIGCSGKPPSEIHSWDSENKQWVESAELIDKIKQQRVDEVWEKIKEARTRSSNTGVYVQNAWWHTDPESCEKYNALGRLLTIGLFPENEEWLTLDGQFIVLTTQIFKEINEAIYEKNKHDFKNSQELLLRAKNLDNPLEIEINTGWSVGFNQP